MIDWTHIQQDAVREYRRAVEARASVVLQPLTTPDECDCPPLTFWCTVTGTGLRQVGNNAFALSSATSSRFGSREVKVG